MRRCPHCALALPDGADICAHCSKTPTPLTACFTAVDYGHPWQSLIHRFKFANEPAWAKWFACVLWQQADLRQTACTHTWWVPVPLSTQRLGERGYNQAWELTKALHKQALQTGPCTATLRHDVLIKVADTTAQHQLDRAERLANLRAAFAVHPASAPALLGKSVLLVDDVMTTGATLATAARTLLHAGAASVSAVVFARTPDPETDSAE